MIREIAGFDWDDGNTGKCVKHGVSLAEIVAVFEQGPRVAPDLNHSDTEQRFIAIRRKADVCRVYIPPTRWPHFHPPD